MTSDLVHASGSATSRDKANTTAHASAHDIDHQLVQDLVADLASRITSKTARDSASTSPERAHLRQLTALVAIRGAADELATTAAFEAARGGANYPAIGDAAGITRQAARDRWPGLVGRTRTVRTPSPDATEVGNSMTDGEGS
ncbi:hypothetical protein AB0H28_26955 [Micromonospora sp. NPDC050980]|uniref:hypothetical protein n=1 Tax=Micromonospora sp. NPDC050980 TaxID=3155161 RepID=UPI00340C1A67